MSSAAAVAGPSLRAAKLYPRIERRRVARGVGPAHVERAEELRLHEAAADSVARLGEDPPHERLHVQEGEIIVGREDPLGRQQVVRGIDLRVFVAQDGEELHGAVVGPAAADRRGVEAGAPPDAERPQRPLRRLPGPARAALADLDRVTRVRRRQQPRRAGEEGRTGGRHRRPVPRVVEPLEGMGVAGEPRRGVVAGRGGELDPQRPPLPGRRGVGEPGGIVARNDAARCAEVAGASVDRQFHGCGVSAVERNVASNDDSVPWRWTTASSVTISTGR